MVFTCKSAKAELMRAGLFLKANNVVCNACVVFPSILLMQQQCQLFHLLHVTCMLVDERTIFAILSYGYIRGSTSQGLYLRDSTTDVQHSCVGELLHIILVIR